ncbi:hypothetical protein PV326_010900 [Microctonus aethiopoides]|nr:hypothetical protein PV326_010900 [Microctonus aethiopoides]
MVEEKQLDETIADKIGTYVSKRGDVKLANDQLREDEMLMKQPKAKEGLKAMELLLKYCDIYRVTDKMVFDLSLARDSDAGSVAGGGRYDNLVGMLDPKKKNVPCVGVSIGVERIFSVLKNQSGIKRTTEVQIFVASAKKNFQDEQM